ncbi:MAG: PTS sugar transporter subunit IIB, partial [Bacillota bacterium]
MGSSLILRMSVEKAFKALGIEAAVDHCDLGGFGGRRPDVVVTTPALKASLPAREGMRVITVTNFVDVEGLKKAIVENKIQPK